MAPMVKKICLDSSVLISILTGREETKKSFEMMEASFYTTSISSFELWVGRKQDEPVSKLLDTISILDLDDQSARKAADIHRDLQKKGSTLELKDLFIGSICISNGMELWTYNLKDFERLEAFGLRLIPPGP